MRKLCDIKDESSRYCRCMIYSASERDVYLFLYDQIEDGPASADHWYGCIEEAESAAIECGASGEWQEIDDPVKGAQHDWIRPARIKNSVDETKQFGSFESIIT